MLPFVRTGMLEKNGNACWSFPFIYEVQLCKKNKKHSCRDPYDRCKVVLVYDRDDHLTINLFFEAIVAIIPFTVNFQKYIKRFRCLLSFDLAT